MVYHKTIYPRRQLMIPIQHTTTLLKQNKNKCSQFVFPHQNHCCMWLQVWMSRLQNTREHFHSLCCLRWIGCRCCQYNHRSCSCHHHDHHCLRPRQRWSQDHLDPTMNGKPCFMIHACLKTIEGKHIKDGGQQKDKNKIYSFYPSYQCLFNSWKTVKPQKSTSINTRTPQN